MFFYYFSKKRRKQNVVTQKMQKIAEKFEFYFESRAKKLNVKLIFF